MANSWATGLVKQISEAKNLIISTECAVVIADKYPKARHHYLVLPTADIPSIFNLRREHLPLLDEMHLLAQNIIEIRREKLNNFKIGFHAQPSMQRLHLHVISKDFVSDCLKTKKHWNSFNTALFVTYESLYEELEKTGQITRLNKDKIEALSKTELRCNQCEKIARNMPELSAHLREHLCSV